MGKKQRKIQNVYSSAAQELMLDALNGVSEQLRRLDASGKSHDDYVDFAGAVRGIMACFSDRLAVLNKADLEFTRFLESLESLEAA